MLLIRSPFNFPKRKINDTKQYQQQDQLLDNLKQINILEFSKASRSGPSSSRCLLLLSLHPLHSLLNGLGKSTRTLAFSVIIVSAVFLLITQPISPPPTPISGRLLLCVCRLLSFFLKWCRFKKRVLVLFRPCLKLSLNCWPEGRVS